MCPRSLSVALTLASALLAHPGCVDLTEPWSVDAGSDKPSTPVDQPKTGILALYPCDEDGGGFLFDHSNNGRNAKLEGTSTSIPGRQGSAVAFNAAGYASVPAGILNGATALTIATWVNLTSNPPGQHVFDFSSDLLHAFSLTTNSSGDPRGLGYMALRAGMATTVIEVAGPPGSLGVWTHWAVTADSNAMWTLYMDGFAVGQMVGPSVRDLGITAANWIGRSNDDNDPYLDGAIDDFQIYDHALTPEEVRDLAER